MNFGIIFVTRDRLDTLRKILPSWLEQDLPMLLLTEPKQIAAHKKLVLELGIRKEVVVAGHNQSDMGVGYARMRAVEVADTFGIGAFVMSDDDMKITRGNVRK